MIITTLVENTQLDNNDGLIAEHGLSLHIAFNGNQLLFDTGASDVFSKNAEKLGKNLSDIQKVVISHYHYDHGGGLSRFFELNTDANVYIKEVSDVDCCFKSLLFLKKYIGIDKNLFKTHPNRFSFIKEFTEILPNYTLLLTL
mmetsp:Transcript_791/g.587  ORF Transcript_791/g.587 Transcript_791/m.587 type:complete len:143 (-) Transcript_791:43-471(-)